MAHYLVIVESPAKVKTIKKFLGSNYTVAASQGHVRDLPKSSLGIDVEHDYEPKYITIRGKGDILAALRKEAKKSDKVFLATDPDREGEAISWHLATALKLDEKKMRRITFNEITKNAVKASLKAPRDIDMNLVDAQQARRVLDRMVGYRISPLLWAKVKRGLSAGRVQSVALRLVADREEEINAFIPEEYWTLDVILKIKGEKRPLTAKFYGTDQKKMTIRSEQELNEMQEQMLDKADKMDQLLKQAARVLATNTNYATMVSTPMNNSNKIKFIQLSMVDEEQVIAVIVLGGNVIKNKIINIDEPISNENLLKLNMLLNTTLNGMAIEEINLGLIARLKEQAGIHSQVVGYVLDAVADAIHLDDDMQIYTSGATNIFKYPELSDNQSAQEIISAFEEKQQLSELVTQTLAKEDNTGIQVYIGDETPVQTMRDCSVVTATYELGDGMKGTIGIIGPKRMDYEHVLKSMKRLQTELDQMFHKNDRKVE